MKVKMLHKMEHDFPENLVTREFKTPKLFSAGKTTMFAKHPGHINLGMTNIWA